MAARPPAQLVAPTLGMSGGGVLAGSMTTSGMPALRSCPSCALGQRGEVTRITPSEWWLASALVQLAGRASPCRTEDTAIAVLSAARPTPRRPRRISTAHGLSRPLNTRSISPDAALRRAARCRGYWCWSSSCSTRARVAGGDVGPAVHDLGHGGQRDACLRGDRGERGLPLGQAGRHRGWARHRPAVAARVLIFLMPTRAPTFPHSSSRNVSAHWRVCLGRILHGASYGEERGQGNDPTGLQAAARCGAG